MNLIEPLHEAHLAQIGAIRALNAYPGRAAGGIGYAAPSATKAQHQRPHDAAAPASSNIAFGRFRVLPHRRELLADDKPLRLGGRAYDVLMALVEAHGAVISKDALMDRVWPGRIVEENNLQSQISALRAALGPERDLIRTVSRRGYQFAGEIRVLSGPHIESSQESATAGQPEPLLRSTNLPEPLSVLIGRDQEVHDIRRLAAVHRLVTLTGAGGMGKTRLALAVARELLARFTDGVWFCDLAPLADPALVPVAVGGAAGLEFSNDFILPGHIANALRTRQLLLVLDNCEHVAAAAAELAEAVLQAAPGVHIIATSREPLRAEGERIHPVLPLSLPQDDHSASTGCGATQLFVERARASGAHIVGDSLAACIANICRRLDGMPLAIELAAARAAVLGIEEVNSRLEDCCSLLTGGRRTAAPRHQSLQATLDWSFNLLAKPERAILCRLAVFAGSFTLAAARAVAANAETKPSEVVEGIAKLAEKSLISVDTSGAIARYHLLHTTRAYAREKLRDSGEYESLAARHAEYCRKLLEQAGPEDPGEKVMDLADAVGWKCDTQS